MTSRRRSRSFRRGNVRGSHTRVVTDSTSPSASTQTVTLRHSRRGEHIHRSSSHYRSGHGAPASPNRDQRVAGRRYPTRSQQCYKDQCSFDMSIEKNRRDSYMYLKGTFYVDIDFLVENGFYLEDNTTSQVRCYLCGHVLKLDANTDVRNYQAENHSGCPGTQSENT